MAERSPASNEVRMRSEIKAMLALAALAAAYSDRPAGAADGARGGVYEEVTIQPAPALRTYRHEEMMRKFGFTR